MVTKRTSETQSRNSFLRLFGSSRELLVKANADLARLVESLSRHQQHEAIWALMDCSITIFHTSDWIRATHMDHHASSQEFAQNSTWIRMTRDICNAAKHGDLQWKDAHATTRGPVLIKLEYQRGSASAERSPDRIWGFTSDLIRHDVEKVLRQAISNWMQFLDPKSL